MRTDSLNELFATFVREIESAQSYSILNFEVTIQRGDIVRAEITSRRTYLVPEDLTQEPAGTIAAPRPRDSVVTKSASTVDISTPVTGRSR
jgi:hypothetical protein